MQSLDVADVVLLAAVPILSVGHYPPLLFGGFTSACAVLVLLAPLGWVHVIRGARVRTGPAAAAVALAVWIVIACAFSGAPLLALKGTVGRDASGLIVVAVLGAWGYARGAGAEARNALPYVVVASLVFSGVAGIAQVVLDVKSGSMPLQFGRATGLSPNPVYFGGLMAAAAALVSTLPLLPVRLRWSAVAFFGLCTNLSGSRVAMLAGLATLLAGMLAVPDVRWSRRAYAPSAYVAGLAVASLGSPLFSNVENSTSRGAADAGGRLDAWRYGARAVLDRPIAGWGFGRFRAATQGRFSPEFVRSAASDDVRQAWFDAHNIVLNVAVSIGLVGLVMMAWWVWRSRSVTRPTMMFAATLAITWLAQPAGLATLPLVAIVWGAGNRSFHDSGGTLDGHPKQLAVALLGAGLAVSAALVLLDVRLKRAVDSEDASRIESAATFYPGDSVVADLVAQAWYLEEETDPSLRSRVLRWSQLAADREPDRPYLWSRLGLRQYVLGDKHAAIESLDHALELQPWHLQSWQILYAIGIDSDDTGLVDRSTPALCMLGGLSDQCPAVVRERDG